MKEPNVEEHTNADYCQLLFQSEFSNLVSNKELSSQIFYSLLGEAKDKNIKLSNGEYMDLYLLRVIPAKLYQKIHANLIREYQVHLVCSQQSFRVHYE